MDMNTCCKALTFRNVFRFQIRHSTLNLYDFYQLVPLARASLCIDYWGLKNTSGLQLLLFNANQIMGKLINWSFIVGFELG